MTSHTANRQIFLKRRPNGIPQPEDFALREAPIPSISQGEF
jgi:NADPH-dependent curcumin reductase CurA